MQGKFSKEQLHAQGIVTKYIDTIDPTAECESDSRNHFITFKMMLRSFLDANRITDCLKLNSVAAEESSCTGDSITATVQLLQEMPKLIIWIVIFSIKC